MIYGLWRGQRQTYSLHSNIIAEILLIEYAYLLQKDALYSVFCRYFAQGRILFMILSHNELSFSGVHLRFLSIFLLKTKANKLMIAVLMSQ